MKTAAFYIFFPLLDQNDVVLTRQKSKRRRLILSAVLIFFRLDQNDVVLSRHRSKRRRFDKAVDKNLDSAWIKTSPF